MMSPHNYFTLVAIIIMTIFNQESSSNKNSSQLKNNSIEIKIPGSGAAPGSRNLVNFFFVTECSTKCSPLSYVNYGCFCGFGGNGEPMNDIDKCCRAHDRCYDATSCVSITEYTTWYSWNCTNQGGKCVSKTTEACATQLCKCGQAMSECVKKCPCPTKDPGCSSGLISRLVPDLIKNILGWGSSPTTSRPKQRKQDWKRGGSPRNSPNVPGDGRDHNKGPLLVRARRPEGHKGGGQVHPQGGHGPPRGGHGGMGGGRGRPG